MPPLTAEQIRAWAQAHRDRTGSWPQVKSEAIPEAPGKTWSGVNAALAVGMRGLPGRDSLAQLLLRAFGKRNPADVPRLSITMIREWILRHYRLKNEWPKYTSGSIEGVPGETWCAVDNALSKGRRGLPGGTTLARLMPILGVQAASASADSSSSRMGSGSF